MLSWLCWFFFAAVLIDFTEVAKRSVLTVSSKLSAAGEIAAIITVFELPLRELSKRWVSFEFRNGTKSFPFAFEGWEEASASLWITRARLVKLWLIIAPSFSLSPLAWVLLCRSDP